MTNGGIKILNVDYPQLQSFIEVNSIETLSIKEWVPAASRELVFKNIKPIRFTNLRQI